ncbi:MAG TPA: transferrin receptor-like dimerization domain-containing protein, partial [Bacteroidia bacterium]|nr:transferrin receptor-like dimerization domain-containing protein [Bacteroidia bacterium]
KYYTYASDPTKTFVAPAPKDEVPFIDFSPLQNALAKLKTSAESYQQLVDANRNLSASTLHQLNVLLFQSERKLMLDNGLPNRPWYKHSIYAPGYYTGYGVKTMPAIREAIESYKWQEAQQQITETTKAIEAYVINLDAAVALLKGN